MSPRIPTPPGARRVTVEHAIGDEMCSVVGFLYRGHPGRGEHGYSLGCPAEPASFDPLTVADESGVERPELLPVVEAALEEITAEAIEAGEGE